MTAGSSAPKLFDVGVGTGSFLLEAQSQGFQIADNDFSPQAVAYSRAKHAIEISTAPLSEQAMGAYDAITMWCVVAHVDNTTQFLRDAHQMLKPGGILFIRTPRYCGIDKIGRAIELISFKKLDQVPDRRLNLGHRHQYNEVSIDRQLRRIGFSDVQVQPQAHETFNTATYAEGTGGPMRGIAAKAAPVIDGLIERDLFFKNALMVFATR